FDIVVSSDRNEQRECEIVADFGRAEENAVEIRESRVIENGEGWAGTGCRENFRLIRGRRTGNRAAKGPAEHTVNSGLRASAGSACWLIRAVAETAARGTERLEASRGVLNDEGHAIRLRRGARRHLN